MALDPSQIAASMLKAAKGSLASDWPKARAYAEQEFKRLAQSLVDIGALVAAEAVNEQQARALVQIHRNTTQTVLLTIEGLGIIAVENAINAALDAVRTAVNKGVGLTVL
jgi:hypothetical protein